MEIVKKNWVKIIFGIIIGYSAISSDPQINWLSRLVGLFFVAYWLSGFFIKKEKTFFSYKNRPWLKP